MRTATSINTYFLSWRGLACRVAVVGLLLMTACGAHASICRVTVAGTDSGTGSWSNPLDLRKALGDASCSEIWIKKGVYKPGTSQSDSFTIRADLQVFGGFAGGETAPDQRDAAVNITILSGDIDNNDTVDSNGITQTASDINGSNSHHVVILDGNSTPVYGNTILDGVTITAGDNTNDSKGGGGLWCQAHDNGAHCSPSLSHLVFVGNMAQYGGAMQVDGAYGASSAPVLDHIIFNRNKATANGGAMFNWGREGSSSPVLKNVAFNDNRARFGGALANSGYNGASNPSLIDVTFSNNTADNYGGAMYNGGSQGASSPMLINVTFENNHAINGGAMLNHGWSGRSDPTLVNVTFRNNSADTKGGAIYNDATSGGASSPLLVNVILWGDTALTQGDEIYNADATPDISHSILAGSGGSGVGWDSNFGTDGGGNLDADPMLAPLGDYGGFTRTMPPLDGSAAINATPCATAPFADQRNAPRPDPLSAGLPTRCDIGAVEADATPSDSIFADGFGLPPLRK